MTEVVVYLRKMADVKQMRKTPWRSGAEATPTTELEADLFQLGLAGATKADNGN